MKKIKHWVLIVSFLVPFAINSQTPFQSGNIVVVRLGDGSAGDLANVTVPMFLDEYSPAGTLVQSIALPTTDNGSNLRMSQAFGKGNISLLTLSPNKQFLTLVGFTASPGASVAGINSASVNRTVARIDYNGTINSSTSILGTDIGTDITGFPVSAITDDGTRFWVVHESVFGGGIRYSLLGQSASTAIFTGINVSTLNIENAQLFCTLRAKASTVGGGLPITGPQTITSFPGFPNGFGTSSQHFFADLNPSIPGFDVIYVAENSDYGLSKFSFNPATSSWVLNGTIGGETDLYRGLGGVANGTSVTLYGTKGIPNNSVSALGEIITLTDNTGHNLNPNTFVGTPTVIKTAGANTTFRGIAMAPTAPSISVSAKAFLQGAYNSSISRHKNVTTAWANSLKTNALNQPFNVLPYSYAGSESVPATRFTSDDGVTTDIVDWVLLELHDATTPSTVIARKACFVTEEGKIVDLDGTSNPSFTGVAANNYYIVIRQKGHLGVRSSTTVMVNSGVPVTYDFTTAQSKAFQNPSVTSNAAMKDVSGIFCLWSGNANSNNTVRYTGLNNDAAALLAALGGIQSAVVTNAYHPADINLDGTIRYTGLNNDAAALLAALGGIQSAVLTEHQ